MPPLPPTGVPLNKLLGHAPKPPKRDKRRLVTGYAEAKRAAGKR